MQVVQCGVQGVTSEVLQGLPVSMDAVKQLGVFLRRAQQFPASGPAQTQRLGAEQSDEFGQPFRPHANEPLQGMWSNGVEVVQPFSGTSETSETRIACGAP